MNELFRWLSELVGSWKPWVVIPPWDLGVRVRLGRTAVALRAGIYLRIPFLDEVTLVNTRMRIAPTPPVTLAAGDKVRVVSANVGFRVEDPLLAMLRFTDPVSAVLSMAQSETATGKPPVECEARMRERFAGSGIAIEFFSFTEDVEIPGIRLLQNSWGVSDSMHSAPPGGSSGARY